MITTHIYSQTQRSRHNLETIVLAPYGQEELERVFPVPLELLGYHLAGTEDCFESPERLLSEELGYTHNQSWGIYESRQYPDNFRGILDVTNVNLMACSPEEADRQPRFVQDISISILKREQHGRA